MASDANLGVTTVDIAKVKKSDLNDSDSESETSSFNGDEPRGDDGKRLKLTPFQQIKRAILSFGSNMSKGLIDYGPPYYKDPFRESLVETCYDANPNVVKVHSLLNQRADPNEQDPEDFYFTAMHYCARNGNYLIMRMLRRAGGEVDLINEFGQSPLSLCCMQVSTKDKIQTQNKMFRWLIREGANIHQRDRAGFEPIDYCAMNNDLEKIQYLLEQGAKVRRTNFMLHAKRKPILKHVSDPEVYRVLHEALVEEESKFELGEARRKAVQDEAERDAQAYKNLEGLRKRKEKRAENAKKAAEYDELVAKLEARKKNIAESMTSLTKGKKEREAQAGEYIKDDIGNWNWVSKDKKDTAEAIARNIYQSSAAAMHKYRDKNRLELYQERWKKMGGDGEIELEWDRDTPFIMEKDERKRAIDEEESQEDLLADAALGVEEGDDLEDLLTPASSRPCTPGKK